MARTIITEAMNLTLSLAARYFPEPTLAHVGFLLSGRAHLWRDYEGLSDREKNEYAALLRLRGPKLENELAAQYAILDEFARDSGNVLAFEPLAGPGLDLDDVVHAGYKDPGSVRFTLRGGVDLDEQIQSSIEFLRKQRRRGGQWATAELASDGVLTLRSHGTRRAYQIPTTDLPNPPSGDEPLHVAPSSPHVRVSRAALLALAEKLTATGDPAFTHYHPVATSFLAGLRTPDSPDRGPDELVFNSGLTQLVVAPTGSGKNVVADLTLLELTRQGRAAALAVTNVDGVTKAVQRLERAAELLDLDVRVAALFSQGRVHEQAARALERDPHLEGEGAWALERLAYPCRLSAYQDANDPDPLAVGDEPCFRLTVRHGGADHNVWCPFQGECPKFREYRRAATADLLVINHHALLGGKMPIVLDQDRPRMLEFALSRAELVLVDEVDALQNTAIDNGSGRVTLKSFKSMSDLQRARDDLDQAAGPGPIAGDRPRPLDGLLRVSTETLDLVNKELVDWRHIVSRGGVLWEGALDGVIGKKLYPDNRYEGERPALIDELYDPDSKPQEHQAIAAALKPFTQVNLTQEDSGSLQRHVVDLRQAIKTELSGLTPDERRKLANQLLVRGNVQMIGKFLDRARDRLAEAAAIGSEAAARAREDLGRFSAWSVSPNGALGRTVAGFDLTHDKASIDAVTMSGDPHGDVIELGELTARAQAGTARSVIGLSASAYFPGSPANHVLAPIAYYLPDQPERVTIHAASVDAGNISGTTGETRLDNVRATVEQLWSHYLRDRLANLQEQDPARARALIVTGNYAEAEAAAQALARTIGHDGDRQVRYVARDDTRGDPKVLLREEIEAFSSLDGARILIAPRAIIARGYNIMAAGRSAISSIYMLVRPIPPTADMNRSLAYVSYNIRRQAPKLLAEHATPIAARRVELKTAGGLFRQFRRANPAFTMLPNDLQHQLLADVYVDLLQIVGRARRGDTRVDVYFVDSAFHNGSDSRWEVLAQRTLDTWRKDGQLDLMRRVHRSLIEALEDYAQQAPNLEAEEA